MLGASDSKGESSSKLAPPSKIVSPSKPASPSADAGTVSGSAGSPGEPALPRPRRLPRRPRQRRLPSAPGAPSPTSPLRQIQLAVRLRILPGRQRTWRFAAASLASRLTRLLRSGLTVWASLSAAIASATATSAATVSAIGAAASVGADSRLAVDHAWRSRCVVSVGRGVELRGVGSFFHEISDVEEGVALEANVHKAGLHAWKDAGYAAVIDGAGERVFVLALVIDFCEGVVFDDGQTRLVGRAGDVNFLRHGPALSARSGLRTGWRAAGQARRSEGRLADC